MRSLFISLALFLALFAPKGETKKPHIVLLLADDFGWNNVGYHVSAEASERHAKEVHTPNIDGLVAEGIELDRHYAYKICGPSRSALQSGRLAVHVNVVNTSPQVQNPDDPVSGFAGVPRNMTGFAEKLKRAGYRTHMAGKWDAGCATPEQTPQGRGFDSWRGYYQHANDYWAKSNSLASTGEVNNCLNRFKDLSEGNATYRGGVVSREDCSDKTNEECYEPHQFMKKSLDVIARHNTTQPLLLFHAFHLMHTPLEIPDVYLDIIGNITKPYTFDYLGRKKYAAMVYYMDSVVGKIVAALKARPGMYENTLIVFFSDNGGPIYFPGSANNSPLRGGKYSDWEGGVRTNAFISGGLIPEKRRGSRYDGIVTIADWYSTFCHLAEVDAEDAKAAAANEWLREKKLPLLPPIDSVPQFENIISGAKAENRVVHISEQAVIDFPWKLIVGVQPFTGWTGDTFPNCSCTASQAGAPCTEPLNAPWFNDMKVFNVGIPVYKNFSEMEKLLWAKDCGEGCLFNILEDPTEHNDLAQSMPDKLATMQNLLKEKNKKLFMPDRGNMSFNACRNSALVNGGFIGPFVDSDDFYTNPHPIPGANETLMLLKLVNLPFLQRLVINWAKKRLPSTREDFRKAFGGECTSNETAALDALSLMSKEECMGLLGVSYEPICGVLSPVLR